MKLLWLVFALLLLSMMLCACSQNAPLMRDGYYCSEDISYDSEGWKKYIAIYVRNNKIVTIEYNSKNSNGLIKSWDVDYMRWAQNTLGSYPMRYARAYAAELLARQDPALVRPITGALDSHAAFQHLVHAAIAQAKQGNKQVAYIKLPPLAAYQNAQRSAP